MKFYEFLDKQPPIGRLVVVEGTDPLFAERAVAEIESRLLDEATRDLNAERFSGPALESPAPVEAACATLPFIGAARVVVVRDAHEMKAAPRRALWEVAQRVPEPNTLVLVDLQSPLKRAKPETFGQLAGKSALRVDVTATSDARARFVEETLAGLGATAEPAAIAALAAADNDVAAMRTDLEKLSIGGRVTLAALMAETLTTPEAKTYKIAEALVAGRAEEALEMGFEFFASEGARSAPRLYAAIAQEYQLVWECARGGELPPKLRWRERNLRPVARRLGARGALRGFVLAMRACEASVRDGVADPRTTLAALVAGAAR